MFAHYYSSLPRHYCTVHCSCCCYSKPTYTILLMYVCVCIFVILPLCLLRWWACVFKNWINKLFWLSWCYPKFVLIFWVDKKCCFGGQSKYALFLFQWSDGHLSLTLSHWQLFIAQKIWKKCLFTILLRITWWCSKLFLSCFPYLSWIFDLITSFWTK